MLRRQILANEMSISDRNSVLRKEGKSFRFALEYYNQASSYTRCSNHCVENFLF